MVTVLPSHYQITMKSSLSLALQVAKPQGKLKNSGVSSLSLLQRIFKAQESNWGLLHYRLSVGIVEGTRVTITQSYDKGKRRMGHK